ncbi:MAG: hypothetical protein ACI837_001901 [Crocinitomicaceae bacterium]|jgi:hypothetical protein
MKTTITLILLFLTGTIIAQTQPLITGTESFETWETAESGQLPEFWDGFNRIILFAGSPVGEVACIEKNSLDPKDGNYSVKLTSKSIMGGPAVPGILTSGDLNVDFTTQSGDIDGGIPFTQKPDRFVGWYKYTPNGADSAYIDVAFTEDGIQVGQGSIFLTATSSGWAQFTVDLSYNSGANPDSMNVVFMTTTEQTVVPEGSILEIDAVSFETDNLGINNLKRTNWMVYPNPAKDLIHVKSTINQSGLAQLIDLSGRVCHTMQLNKGSTQIDISGLAPGLYQVHLSNNEGDYSTSIIVE